MERGEVHCNHGDAIAFQFEQRNSKNLTKCYSIFIVITFANFIEDFIVPLHIKIHFEVRIYKLHY